MNGDIEALANFLIFPSFSVHTAEQFRALCNKNEQSDKVIIDYGGANVAKPLHVGHLRSAVIGESIKRIRSHHDHDATFYQIHLENRLRRNPRIH